MVTAVDVRKAGAPDHRFEMVVCGGGVVGATAALLLAHAGLRTALIDGRDAAPDPAWTPADHDARVLALTLASVQVFETLGVWPRVLAARVGQFERMEVWDPRGRGRIHFDAAEVGSARLGWVVEVSVLQAALDAAIAATPDAVLRVFRGARLQSFGDHASGRLHLDLGTLRLQTALLIGADGSQSRVRTLAGLGWAEHDYGEQAIAATLRSTWPHGNVARQAFLATGPLALLPLEDPSLCTLVWSQPAGEADRRLALSTEDFAAELTAASGGVLGGLQPVGAIRAFRLSRGEAQAYIGPRVALMGDAAHVIHPLAGQGANLGFMDAATLSSIVSEAAEGGRDPGSRAVLRRYERWRRGENRSMQLAMDGFRWLFGGQDPARYWARNCGLLAMDRLPLLKRQIMRRALGLEGDLPAISRPQPGGWNAFT